MLEFVCHECHNRFYFTSNDDPTSRHGCCKVCGGDNWHIYNTNDEVIA